MLIHEYQAKRILKKYGFPIPPGYVAYTPTEAEQNAQYMEAEEYIIKAQIHNNGLSRYTDSVLKNKVKEYPGIKIVQTRQEIRDFSASILNTPILVDGKPREVKRVLVEKYVFTKDHISVSFSLNAIQAQFICTVDDKAILIQSRRDFDIFASINENLPQFLSKCYDLLFLLDIKSLSFLPLGIMDDDTLVILEAQMVFDDYALSRHPDLLKLYDSDEEDMLYRQMRNHSISYYPSDGNIAIIGTGGGLLLLMQDVLKDAGKKSVFSMDIGTQTSKDSMLYALRHALRSPEVDGFLIALLTGPFPCDFLVEALIQMMKEISFGVPVLLTLSGKGDDTAKDLLKAANVPVTLIPSMDQLLSKVKSCF